MVAAGARLLVDVEFGPGNTLYALSQGVWDGPREGTTVEKLAELQRQVPCPPPSTPIWVSHADLAGRYWLARGNTHRHAITGQARATARAGKWG